MVSTANKMYKYLRLGVCDEGQDAIIYLHGGRVTPHSLLLLPQYERQTSQHLQYDMHTLVYNPQLNRQPIASRSSLSFGLPPPSKKKENEIDFFFHKNIFAKH